MVLAISGERWVKHTGRRAVIGAVRRRPTAPALAAVVISSLMLVSVNAGLRGAAAANLQDGTDTTTVTCTLPGPINEALLPEAAATPVASPVAQASPAAGEPADAVTAAEIDRLVRVLAICLTGGQSQTVAQLVTERYLGAQYGGGGRLSRDEYLALAADLPAVAVTVSAVSDVRVPRKGRATADVVTVVGNQLVHGRWSFVRQGAQTDDPNLRSWQVDTITALPVAAPADATRVRVTLDEYRFDLSRAQASGPDVIFSGVNTGKEDHEILVLHLDRGVNTDRLLREPGPGLPDGITFVGQVTIPAGTSADLVLVGLTEGSYALVCLIPDEDGTPHLSLGMKARFRIA